MGLQGRIVRSGVDDDAGFQGGYVETAQELRLLRIERRLVEQQLLLQHTEGALYHAGSFRIGVQVALQNLGVLQHPVERRVGGNEEAGGAAALLLIEVDRVVCAFRGTVALREAIDHLVGQLVAAAQLGAMDEDFHRRRYPTRSRQRSERSAWRNGATEPLPAADICDYSYCHCNNSLVAGNADG